MDLSFKLRSVCEPFRINSVLFPKVRACACFPACTVWPEKRVGPAGTARVSGAAGVCVWKLLTAGWAWSCCIGYQPNLCDLLQQFHPRVAHPHGAPAPAHQGKGLPETWPASCESVPFVPSLFALESGRHGACITAILLAQVPNATCNCIAIRSDGTLLLSGWYAYSPPARMRAVQSSGCRLTPCCRGAFRDDGKIRAFTPETGKLKFEINNAHNKVLCARGLSSLPLS
jgi:hypothetical protein